MHRYGRQVEPRGGRRDDRSQRWAGARWATDYEGYHAAKNLSGEISRRPWDCEERTCSSFVLTICSPPPPQQVNAELNLPQLRIFE